MRRIAMQLTLAFSNFPVLHNRRQAINSTPKHAPRLSAFWHASSRKPSRQSNKRRRPMNDVTKVGVYAQEPVLTLDVHENLQRRGVIAERQIGVAELTRGLQFFSIEFDAAEGNRVEFRVF